MDYRIIKYSNEYRDRWDKFVLEESMNGTFLQTRRFIEYHPQERFEDCSLIFLKGNSIIATLLACLEKGKDEVVMYSHKGSTYGGLVISPNIYTCTAIDKLIVEFEKWLCERKIDKIILKQTPSLFSRKSTELIDYFLCKEDFIVYNELNFYLDLEKYTDNIEEQFSSSKRRDYRYSLRNNLEFHKLNNVEEIGLFYQVLCTNLKSLGLACIHTLDELVDFHNNRLTREVEFYGVFLNKKIIAGTMLFYFDNSIVHTQYLASLSEYRNLYSMDFLIYNLIKIAKDKRKRYFTFGICTENMGKCINLGLARFKEGFGTDYSINQTYEKSFIYAQIPTEGSNGSYQPL